MGTKDNEIEDILGKTGEKTAKAGKAAKAAKEPKAKDDKSAKEPKAAKVEKPAKKAAWDKGDKSAKEAAEPKAKRNREPVTFEEGERDKIAKKVTKQLDKVDKKGINSKELAAAVGTDTRKLRAVLYSMERAGECGLKPGASRAAGMTVCPPKAGKPAKEAA